MSDEWCRSEAQPARSPRPWALLHVGLLLGALFMTAGCGDPGGAGRPGDGIPTGEWSTAGCALPRTPTVTTMGAVTVPATPAALGAAIARIDGGGRARFARSYAGLEVDQQLVRAVVYRMPSAAFDDFVRTSAEDSCVVVRDAAHSLAELTRWHQRIASDLGTWADQGIRISTVGARHDGAGVEIGTQDVDLARRELPAHYGVDAPLVFVEQGPVTPLPRTGQPPAAQPGG
jgi:hypothetical protein